MKRKQVVLIVCLLAVVAVIAAAGTTWFNVQADQYENRFIEGTFINGRNVGNMTAEEVEEDIRRKVEDYRLTVQFRGNDSKTLTTSDIGFRYESDGRVREILKEQNKRDWLRGKMGETASYTVGELYDFDKDKLRSAILALPEMDPDSQTAPSDAYMEVEEGNRITIVPENDGSRIDAEKVIAAAEAAVKNGESNISVEELGAYSHADIRSDDPSLACGTSELNMYLDTAVTYTLYDGSQLTLDRDTIGGWLSDGSGENGVYELSDEALKEGCRHFIDEMADRYDYTKDTVIFHSTDQGDLTFSTDPYGRVIDRDAEAEILSNMILTHRSEKREPVYSLKRDADGGFGGTYIEVDIEAQHAWYYEDHELRWESDCVTGKDSDPSRRTPKGVYDIYNKEKNRTLRGEVDASGRPSYESFVNFWMPFYEGCGLHDASWRGSFGGSIYLYDGSHGCVNLPYWAAESLYNMVEVGTPVIVI